MTENLDHRTFDLARVLAGIDYPETDVDIYFNERLGYAIYQLREEVVRLERMGKHSEAGEVQKELDKLLEESREYRYRVKVRMIPEGIRKQILKETMEEFPEKKNLLGMPEGDSLERDDVFTRRLWAKMIVHITDPSGAISYMDDDLALAFQAQAPRTAQAAINSAIEKLEEGTEAGFEYAAREVDFLSIASPEG